MAYATRAELADMGGLPAPVVAQFTADEQDRALEQASGVANDYLSSSYGTPLETPSIGLKMRVCRVAAYFLMRRLGFDPEVGANSLIVSDYEEALAWFEKVARGIVPLAGAVDATPSFDEAIPLVISGELRGW